MKALLLAPLCALLLPVAAHSGTIYLCKGYDGGTFWAQAHCNQHKAIIDRIVSVPDNMPFQQQVEVAQQRVASSRELTQQMPPQPTVNRQSQVNAECKALDERVTQLDAMARQPQSGQMQDWIRGERKTARDRQFALRC